MSEENDSGENCKSSIWIWLAFLVPALGCLLYFTNRHTRPEIAKSAARKAKAGVALYVLGAVVEVTMLINEEASTVKIEYTANSGASVTDSSDYFGGSDLEVDEWDSDLWESDGDLNTDALKDETDIDGSDGWSNTIDGHGTAAQIVLKATSDQEATISFVIDSKTVEEDFVGNYERVLTAAEVEAANDQNYITTIIYYDESAESVTCSIEIDGVERFSNAVFGGGSGYNLTLCNVSPID